MKPGEHGFSTLEILPALLLLAAGLSLSARMLWGSWRAEEILRQGFRREGAYAAVQNSWQRTGGMAAVARLPGTPGSWEVLDFPHTGWLPEIGTVPPGERQYLFRRRKSVLEGGRRAWVVEWKDSPADAWRWYRTCLAENPESKGTEDNGP